jgi:hypothetical protein
METIESALRDGYSPFKQRGGLGSSVQEAARRLNVKSSKLESFLRTEINLANEGKPNFLPDWSLFSDPETVEPPAQTRIEKLGTDFWRKRATDLEKDLASVEHRLEQVAGIRDSRFAIPEWLLRDGSGRRGKSVIGCLVSDVHDGEVISSEELNGLNAFNPEICEKRMHRYYSAVCTIGQRWADDTDCKGVLLALAGDLMSGDIHEELRITNALTSQEQCIHSTAIHVAGIKMLLETYGAVHVVGVPGNHGRSTHKPTAKMYARLSYDNLILAMIESHFTGDSRVTFQYGAAKDQMTPVFGRTVLTTHGDKIGTKGGMGFAGPVLPIVRGSKKIEAQQASVGRRPDLIQFGHYHTTANPGNILANGSVPGYSEYADDLRAGVEPPQQWAYLLHDKWWMRERMPIQLEDPAAPQKPRVTVPAGWQTA